MSRKVVHRNLAVLQVADPEVLRELEIMLPLGTWVIGRLSPTELLVDPRKVKDLSERLEAHGLAPLLRRAR